MVGHTDRMPRILASTVAENREQRRAALLNAAATLILRDGTFTVAEVASEVGLSRSAVYEYYSSAADLIADVLLDELGDWRADLDSALAEIADPHEQIRAWVHSVLAYVGDGRHALVKAAGAIDLPAERRSAVQAQHRALMDPLASAVAALGFTDPGAVSMLVWGAVDASITRVESGLAAPGDEAVRVLAFIEGGLTALHG